MFHSNSLDSHFSPIFKLKAPFSYQFENKIGPSERERERGSRARQKTKGRVAYFRKAHNGHLPRLEFHVCCAPPELTFCIIEKCAPRSPELPSVRHCARTLVYLRNARIIRELNLNCYLPISDIFSTFSTLGAFFFSFSNRKHTK